VFFAFGSKVKFRPQQSRSYTDKRKRYITRYAQIYISFSTIILQRFLQNFLQKSLLQQLLSFSSSFFSFMILYILKQNEEGAEFKEKVKVTSISLSPA
jgi:predicted neutral ceramidase superfamily lipid hydrolase